MADTFGVWVRKTRESKGWSQNQLADESGVSQPQIWNIEVGNSLNPQIRTREKLQKALGATPTIINTDQINKETLVPGIGSLTDFDPHEDESLPDASGVYVFYDITDRPVYVGKAVKQSIRERVRQHHEKFWV